MSRIRPAAILGLCAASAAGCSTPPLERQENIEVRELDTIPRTVFLEVDGEELFGGHDQWREELTRNFKVLRVCTAVLTGDPERADLRLKVYLRAAGEPAPSRVDLQGALLDFLAWSTVPLLPLWIPDVYVDPGLSTEVLLSYPGTAGVLASDPDLRPPTLKTTQLDRHEILSWPMAGALFLPPFVFGSPDRERIDETLAERVRLETACRIADLVKREMLKDEVKKDELLRSPEVRLDGQQRYLHYTASKDLVKITLRVETLQQDGGSSGNPAPKTVWFSHLRGPGRARVSLEKLDVEQPSRQSLLRIDALGRNGQRRSYSIRLVAGDPVQVEKA